MGTIGEPFKEGKGRRLDYRDTDRVQRPGSSGPHWPVHGPDILTGQDKMAEHDRMAGFPRVQRELETKGFPVPRCLPVRAGDGVQDHPRAHSVEQASGDLGSSEFTILPIISICHH